MMRPLYIAAILVAVTLTYGLYSMKYEVQRLEAKLSSLYQQRASEREAIQVLRAEWSYLNNPGRLESLASRHLTLVPVAVHRVNALAAIPIKDSTASASERESVTRTRSSHAFPG